LTGWPSTTPVTVLRDQSKCSSPSSSLLDLPSSSCQSIGRVPASSISMTLRSTAALLTNSRASVPGLGCVS
jgi:hypothetical protein